MDARWWWMCGFAWEYCICGMRPMVVVNLEVDWGFLVMSIEHECESEYH